MSAFAYSRAIYLLSQILLVPLFVSRWGAVRYGEWLALTAVSAYLGYVSFGMAQVIRSEMSLAHAGGERERAARTFQTALVTVAVLCAIGAGAFALGLSRVDLHRALNLASLAEPAALRIVALLCLQIVLLLLFGVVSAGLSAIGAYDLATALDANRQLADLVGLAVLVGVMGQGPTVAAAVFPVTAGLTLVAAVACARRRAGWLFGSFGVAPAAVLRLWQPLLGTFLLNFGYTGLIVQAPRLVLAGTVGPQAVASYAICTMLMRLVRIPIEVPSFSATVEISTAFGKGDLPLARALIRDATRFSLWAALLLIPVVVALGPAVVHLWSVGQVRIDRGLLAVLGIATIAFAAGLPAQEGLMALNRLMAATAWLLLLSVPFVLLCLLLSRSFGTLGAGAATMLLEVAFAVIVTGRCLRCFGYPARAFVRGLTPPVEIVAATAITLREAVARRVRRRREA